MRTLLAALTCGCVLLLLAACGSTSGQGGTFTTISEAHAVYPSDPINPFNQDGNSYDGYNSLMLAYPADSPVNPNKMYPALAQRWSLSSNGRTLTVWLQPKARWSNGAEVTSKDVKTSMAVAFALGDAQAFDLDTVKIINDKEFQLIALPGTSNPLYVEEALDNPIVANSVWSKELPSNIWQTIAASNGTGPAATTAQAALKKLSTKLTDFGPKKDVSAGPFVLKSLNAGEVVLTKNPYFYNASAIAPKSVLLLNYTGNEQIWNYLEAGRLDVTPYTSMPTEVMDRALKTKGNEAVRSPSFVATSLGFDENDYPYGMLQVRQAIAYVINRKQIQKVGEPTSGSTDPLTDGVVPSVGSAWLSSSERSSLNPYKTDPSKATSLLTSAGFKKQGGHWVMPNGQPWTMTIEASSGFSDWIAGASLMAHELSSFGIPATVATASDYTTFQTEQSAGKYPVSLTLTALGPSVYTAYDRIYGAYDGYNIVGGRLVRYPASNASEGNWIDLPETVSTPGYGTLNPGQLTYQLGNTTSASAQRQLVAKLAAATNASLPVIQIWDYVNLQFVNDSRYTDFPVGKGGLLNNSPGLWMIDGYIKAK